MIRSYREIKAAAKINRSIDDILSKYTDEKSVEELKLYRDKREEQFKRDCREFYRNVLKWHIDPLSAPIRNNKHWRTVSDDNGDTCTDFIILPDHGQTDEDIEDFVYCSVYCPRYSYDFSTGRMITLSWHFNRTKYGIIIIHERGIDW